MINEFRQYRVQLNTNCIYRCLDCGWWNYRDAVLMTVNAASFSHIPHHRIVKLLGGDPVSHPDFNAVLIALAKRQSQIRLWSTGMGNIDRWLAIVPLLDRLYLYVPSGDPDQYQSIVGTSTWVQWLDQLMAFKSVSDRIWLNYEVRSETIQFLPELVEVAYDNKCPLLIHCDRSKLSDPDSILYVKRFYRVPNVYVFFTRSGGNETRCSGVPYAVTQDRWQWLKNHGYNWYTFYR
jgi:hypothetical protein